MSNIEDEVRAAQERLTREMQAEIQSTLDNCELEKADCDAEIAHLQDKITALRERKNEIDAEHWAEVQRRHTTLTRL